MSTSLFLDQDLHPEFAKIAAPVKLSDNPDNWQKEVASEVYKQLPFIADYAVNVILERVDPQRGYAFGSAEVTNKSDAPTPQQPSSKIIIPLLVKDRQLQPLDVLLNPGTGGAAPLNERRVREQLFRTDQFEASTRRPTDQGMVDQLYPPMRTNYGYGNSVATGTNVGGDGFGKVAYADTDSTWLDKFKGTPLAQQAIALEREALNIRIQRKQQETQDSAEREQKDQQRHGLSDAEDQLSIQRRELELQLAELEAGAPPEAQPESSFPGPQDPGPVQEPQTSLPKLASLLDAIAPTISDSDVERFVNKIVNDDTLAKMAAINPWFKQAALKLAGAPRVSIEKRAQALVGSIRPTVVQFTKLANGNVMLKWANIDAFSPQQAEVGPQQAGEMAGSDAVAGMKPGQSVTMSTELAKKVSLDEPKSVAVESFGKYTVQDENSNEPLQGWVIPVVDFQMQPLPMKVFTDGMSFSAQDDIAGTLLDVDLEGFAQLLIDQPEGDGVFVYISDGHAVCTQPLTVQAHTQGPDGIPEIHVQTVFGEEFVLTPTPGLTVFEEIEEGQHFAIPEDLKWLPLENPIHLVKDPAGISNQADAQQIPNKVEIGATGTDEVSLDGQPLQKVARDQKWFIKNAEAEFLLVGMGVHPQTARQLIKQAHREGKVKTACSKGITPLAYLHAQMVKRAATVLENFPYGLRRDLVKEAAALEDSETADKILAMNFLNPENVSIFANYLPQLDETVCKMAEMLMAARLGMSQVNEGALERGMKNMEEVIQGLKALQEKDLL